MVSATSGGKIILSLHQRLFGSCRESKCHCLLANRYAARHASVCPASPSDRAASCWGASLVKETTTRTHVSAHAAARIRASSGKHGGKDLNRTLRLVARSRRNVLSPTAQRASHRRSDDGKRRVHALMLLLLVVMSIFLSTGVIVYAACRSQRRRDRCMHRHNRLNSLSSRPSVQLPRRRAF